MSSRRGNPLPAIKSGRAPCFYVDVAELVDAPDLGSGSFGSGGSSPLIDIVNIP